MDAIVEIAERFNLVVVEDACQAHGAQYFSKKESRWRTAGSMGKAAAFSFYPGKNLGACGEAGAITTDDEALAHKMRMLRDHGQARKYYHDTEGYNGRLDSIQAGILATKLTHLAQWNAARQAAARRYDDLLSSVQEVVRPYCPDGGRAIFHLYVVRVKDREGCRSIWRREYGTGIHYPVPLHLQKAYEGLGYKRGYFPVTEKAAAEIVSLPCFRTSQRTNKAELSKPSRTSWQLELLLKRSAPARISLSRSATSWFGLPMQRFPATFSLRRHGTKKLSSS